MGTLLDCWDLSYGAMLSPLSPLVEMTFSKTKFIGTKADYRYGRSNTSCCGASSVMLSQLLMVDLNHRLQVRIARTSLGTSSQARTLFKIIASQIISSTTSPASTTSKTTKARSGTGLLRVWKSASLLQPASLHWWGQRHANSYDTGEVAVIKER